MPKIVCHTHCPPEGGGVVIAAAVALVLVLASVVAFVLGHLVLVLSGGAGIAVAEVVILRLLSRRVVLAWRPQNRARVLRVTLTASGRQSLYTKATAAISAAPPSRELQPIPVTRLTLTSGSANSLQPITLRNDAQATPLREDSDDR